MNTNKATLFAFLFILILGMGFAQVSTGSVSYEHEDKAIIRDAFGPVASVELTNTYKKVGTEMYLSDCGLTTCYLTLLITPDAPLDSRTIIGRVVGGNAEYVGAEVYETRVVPVPRNLYKTVERNYTQLNNVSGKNETVFYNESVLDKVVYNNLPVADWYAPNPTLSAGIPRLVRLEYHKANQRETVDLIPEINGVRVDGWAWWASPNYTKRMPLNCSNMADGTLTAINGTAGFNIGDGIQYAYTLCYNNTEENSSLYLYWSNTSNYVVANYTAQIPTDVVGGNGTSYLPLTLYSTVGVVSALHLEETTGTDIIDSSGKANFTSTGNFINGTACMGKFGNCFNSTGATGYLYSPAGYAGLDLGNFTVVMWVRDNANATSYNHDPYSNYQYGTLGLSSGSWYVGIKDTAGWKNAIVAYSFPNGTWYHVAFKGGLGSSSTLYFNAVQKGVSAVAGATYASGTYDPHYFSEVDGTLKTNGAIDEPMIYNRYLSATEISQLYNNNIGTAGYGTLGTLENSTSNSAPVLQSINLTPSTLYHNTTAYCAVNYTDEHNSTFEARQGLSINGTIISAFNNTNTSYTNATVWNISYSLSPYTHGDKVGCWAFANDTATPSATSATNYTTNITISDYAPIISNVQITNPISNGTNATGTADFVDWDGDAINCRWEWFKNGAAIWNSSQSPCLNSSVLSYMNYTVGDLINFTVYANDSYAYPLNATPGYSATVNVTPTFTWNNYTYTNQYESLPYNFSVNFTLPAGNTLNYTLLHFHSTNFTVSCTNVSTTYYCVYNGIPAPFVSTNGTTETETWVVDYYDGVTIEANQSFTPTTYFGAWVTGINSSTIVAGGGSASVNVLYSNASGITATVSGTTWLLGTANSGSLTCVAGACSGSITTSSVSTATLYQVEANLTLTSSYWSSTQNRVVRIENTLYYTAPNATMSNSGTVTNPNNANDSSWTTYATYGSGGMQYFNYTFSQLYYGNWTFKDAGATRNYAIPNDCIRPTIAFRVQRPSASLIFNYSCYNYSSETYSTIYTTGALANAFFYEQNLTRWQNNSLVKVVPFGLTSCATGTPIMTFSVRDEDTNALIVVNYTQNFFLNYLGTTYGYHFNGTDDTWTICLTPSTLNGTYTSSEQYSSAIYDLRSYAITTGVSTLVSANYTRYLGEGGSVYTFIAEDQFGSNIYAVNVTVTKFNFGSSSWEAVSNVLTDYTGAAVFYMTPFDTYHLSFQKTGYSSVDFDFTPSTVSTITVTMAYGAEPLHPPPDLETMWDDVSISFSPAEGYYNESQTLTFTIGSAGSLLQSWGVNISLISPLNGTTTQVYFANTTVLPGGGSMSYITANNGTYTVRAFWKHYNYSFYQPTPRVYFINMNATGLVKARVLLGTSGILSGWALYFALLVVAMVVAGFIARYSIEGAALGGLLVLWFGSLMFPAVCVVALFGGFCLTPVYVTALATITGVAAILAFRGML